MLYLIGVVAILSGLLLLGYVFVNADPARLARNLKWAGIGLAVLALVALVFSGRLFLLLGPVAALMPLLARIRSRLGGFRGPAAGKSSTVASAFLRMTLDHDTGAMTGTVLRGQFAGTRIEELAIVDLFALLRECRAADEDGARMLEAYLDRADPRWRENFSGGGQAPAGDGGEMTVAAARAILGLEPGADAAAIKVAHHRLMMKFHPDHGGSEYFAMQINRARDVLMQHH